MLDDQRLVKALTALIAEREQVLRSAEQRRTYLVRELLEGGEVDGAALGYSLDGAHTGVVAWGPDAPAAVAALASRGAREVLRADVLEDTVWAWLGGLRPLGAAPAPPPGTQVALGETERGPEGFRRTHHQALLAQRAARATGAPVTQFADVALEALALADEPAARAFVARELRGLDGPDVRARRLRDTLRAWFAAGHNAAAAAAALGVHEQTVAQRLRAVEERTGHPPAQRRAELETALRLQVLL